MVQFLWHSIIYFPHNNITSDSKPETPSGNVKLPLKQMRTLFLATQFYTAIIFLITFRTALSATMPPENTHYRLKESYKTGKAVNFHQAPSRGASVGLSGNYDRLHTFKPVTLRLKPTIQANQFTCTNEFLYYPEISPSSLITAK